MKQQAKYWRVKSAAVLGAGVMGTQIAAHLANSGIKTWLYDLKSTEDDPNSLVNHSLSGLKKLKPSPIVSHTTLSYISSANYDDDLPNLQQCDLIIEAISERIDWKTNLYGKIVSFIHDNALLVTNTSGLNISELSKALPDNLKSRFFGLHFFNPPRYMKLAEIISHPDNDVVYQDHLARFVTSHLGKGVIFAKDTPNFIGNRVGVFSLLSILHHAARFKLQPDVVDMLTGTIIGRPKSATYRTLDVVGLDVFNYVVKNQADTLISDPWHSLFKVPDWILNLVEKGAFGQKTGVGIYKKVGREIQVTDPYDGSYRPTNKNIDSGIEEILSIQDPQERFVALQNTDTPEANFLKATLCDLFLYIAYHLNDIAHSPRDIDLAMRWGYGWSIGPFELWQSFGWGSVIKQIEKESQTNSLVSAPSLPKWANEIKEGVYKDGMAWNVERNEYDPLPNPPMLSKQLHRDTVLTEVLKPKELVYETSAIICFTYDQQTLILSFKTKKNTISKQVLEGIQEAVKLAEEQFLSLVIWQEDPQNFSLGANVQEVSDLVKNEQYDEVESFIALFQETASCIQYSAIPVVAAIRGRVLGGGCEFSMHADKIVAASETYIGLVETGIGIIPAGAGCKEIARRAEKNGYSYLEKAFQTLARSEVSQSAEEAKEKGFLRPDDIIVQNTDEVLWVAIQTAKLLAQSAYQPPISKPIKVFGQEALANFKALLANWHAGQFISEHDLKIGTYLANALSGGDIQSGSLVKEQWLLALELKGTFELLQTKETQERVIHTLKTGKPLRN